MKKKMQRVLCLAASKCSVSGSCTDDQAFSNKRASPTGVMAKAKMKKTPVVLELIYNGKDRP